MAALKGGTSKNADAGAFRGVLRELMVGTWGRTARRCLGPGVGAGHLRVQFFGDAPDAEVQADLVANVCGLHGPEDDVGGGPAPHHHAGCWAECVGKGGQGHDEEDGGSLKELLQEGPGGQVDELALIDDENDPLLVHGLGKIEEQKEEGVGARMCGHRALWRSIKYFFSNSFALTLVPPTWNLWQS